MAQNSTVPADSQDAIKFENCECDSPAGDPVVYELPDGERVEIVGCVQCGEAVEWEIDANTDDEGEPEVREGAARLQRRTKLLESQCRRLQKAVENPRNPWEILCYHPDFFDPDETNIDPSNLVSGVLKVKGENSYVYHLPHRERPAVCGKKAFGGSVLGPREFKYEYEVTDDELRSLRPCNSCIKPIQRFRERRITALRLVDAVRSEAE